MGATRESYTPKYRQEAAHLVIDTGRMVAQVAREIGVAEQLLGRWVAVERARMDDPPEAIDVNERAELQRLRREVAELRMDREFPKKAAASSPRRPRARAGVRGDRREESHPQRVADGRAVRGRPLLLEHTGRRTGLVRLVCVEVVERRTPSTVTVASRFGSQAQWSRNVQAHPVDGLSMVGLTLLSVAGSMPRSMPGPAS